MLDAITLLPKAPAARLCIWLHGLGADGNDFVPMVRSLNIQEDLKMKFILPHASIIPVTMNFGMKMPAWFDIYGLNHDSRQDEKGILQATQTIHTLIQQENAKGIANSQIVLAGFSQGGALALFAGTQLKTPIAGIIGLSTLLPLSKQLPKAEANSPQIFLAHGQQDTVISPQLGRDSKNALIQAGYPVDWQEYPMAHEVCWQEIEALRDWFLRVF